MVKSLDNLIRHLIDEIALCGEEGALPSDYLKYVYTYYEKQSQQDNGTVTCSDGDESNLTTCTVDRPFQEQIWKWLTRHPEIRVGKSKEGNKLRLCDVEALNSTHSNHEQSRFPDGDQTVSVHNTPASSSHKTHIFSDNPDNPDNGPSAPAKKWLKGSSAKSKSTEEPSIVGGLRLYVSEERMWRVVAGHGVDHSKVPAMDFVCLSIIAARGPKGILQPELVVVSGQDKRSLPRRTDHLHKFGYIEKRPVLVSGSRTSMLTLKRFVTAPTIIDRTLKPPKDTSLTHPNNESVLDLISLTHGIFDNLRELEIIATEDLKKKLGVWGHRWPMKVLARTLRKLEALGCVKQVKAQANSDLATAFYFKCVKLIREPDESEWQYFISPHRGLSHAAAGAGDEYLDADGEIDEDYDPEHLTHLEPDIKAPPLKNLHEVERPVAQWDGDCCLNNFLFEIIDRSGTQGMSTMDVKRHAFGGLVKRPLEYQLGRLVDQWQISQPPHLRHLAIIRDTAMNKSVAHFIHYSYRNFKDLVDSGKASWEAVETISETKKKGKNKAAAVTSEPDLDEYGFPKLQANLFQGTHNDAAPFECALAVKIRPLFVTSLNAISKKLDGDIYALRYEGKDRMPQSRRGLDPSQESTKSTPQRLSFKPRGRPRKVPRTGQPANLGSMTADEISKVARLQQAAMKYDVFKIEREIDRRVDEGDDYAIALDIVLREVADEHTQLGLPPSFAAKAVRVRSSMPGDKEEKPILPEEVLAQFAAEIGVDTTNAPKAPKAPKRVGRPSGKKISQPPDYLPSVAAHSWPILSKPLLAPTILSESRPEKRMRLPRTQQKSTDFTYFPSIAAHSQPTLQPGKAAENTITTQSRQESTKGSRRNKRKLSRDLSSFTGPASSQNTPVDLTEYDSFPPKKHKQEMAARKSGDVASRSVPIDDASLKRKRSASELVESNKKIVLEYLPSIAAHSQRIIRPQENSLWNGAENQKKSTKPVGGYFSKDVDQVAVQKSLVYELPSNRTESEIKNYRKQCNDIKRPKNGVFIGRRTTVYRKGGSGPRKSQFAIFKLPHLNDFSWFQKEVPKAKGLLQASTVGYFKAHLSTNSRYSSILSSIDDNQSRIHMSSKSSVRVSQSRQVGSIHASPYNPHPKKKAKQIASSAKTSMRQLPDPALTCGDEPGDPIASQRAQGPNRTSTSAMVGSVKPNNQSNGTISTLSETLAQKRPSDLVHDGAPKGSPEDSLGTTEGLVSTLNEHLNRGFDQGSHSQLSRSIRSNITADESMLGEVKKIQGTEVGSFNVTGIVTNSCNGSGLSRSQTAHQPGPSGSHSVSVDHLTNAPLEDVVETNVSSKAKVTPKLSLTGGSVGYLRRNIVMNIVQACGGVFPSDKELVYPFVYAWQKEGKPGTPERPTVTAICKSLYASGKLRQLYFSFKDKKGLMVTKPMMGLREISPTDPRVKVVQQKIIDFYPKPYIPEEAEVSEAVRNKISIPWAYGSNRTLSNLQIDHEARVQLQHKPQYIQRKESSLNSRIHTPDHRTVPEVDDVTGKATTIADNSNDPYINPLANNTHGFIRRPDLDPTSDRPVRKVQRLASLKKSPIVIPAQSYTRYDPILTSKSSSITGPLRPHAYHSESNTTQDFNQRTLVKKRTKPYLPSIAAHTQPIYKPVTIKRKYIKRSQTFWNPKLSEPSMKDETLLLRSPSGSPEFSYDLVSSVAEEVSRVKVVYALHTSTALSIDPWYSHQQRSTIMDPDHQFHSVTGTFSAMFNVPKKWDRKSQTLGRKKACKADRVYSNWGLTNQSSVDWISPPLAPIKTTFHDDIDYMLYCELETGGFALTTFTDHSFVNFTFKHPQRLSNNATTNMDKAVSVSFSKVDGRTLYKPFAPSIVPRPKVNKKMVSNGTRRTAPVVPDTRAGLGTPAKRKRQKEPKEQFMSRRLTSLPEGQSFGRFIASGEAIGKFDAEGRPNKLRRIRGPQLLHGLGKEGEKRLVFATLVIRTLTGGLERHIDWVLIARLFAPKFDQMYIQNRWNAVMNKWRFQYERLNTEFEDRFVQAYEDGLIPPIDYDDLENYDWAWLVDWAMENIAAPTKALPDLPAERSKWDERFTVKESHESNMHSFFETDVVQTLPLRTNNLLKQSYVVPFHEKSLSTPLEESEQMAVAKSRIRANIITPNASYNSDLARERLNMFKESTIELALKELLATRVLSQQNKGRLVPGRNYNISQHLLDRLKKNLELKYFHCASSYKRQLDRDLMGKGAVDFSTTAEDGIILAVMNMQAHGRIEIRPKNPPMNKFGLTDGGYQTRKMDKRRLNFACEIRPTDTYLLDNPLLPLPPPPCQHQGTPMSKIPLWYDINDKLVPEVWDMVLAAIMAVLSMRPGIGAKELEKSMRPALEVWELDLVLDWMVFAKAAKKVGRGFMVDEWWWLCMDQVQGEKDAETGAAVEINRDVGET